MSDTDDRFRAAAKASARQEGLTLADVSVTPPPETQAHGVYTREGQRINEWQGRIIMDFHTGEPRMEPPLRLGRDEVVFLWWRGRLAGMFGNGGAAVRNLAADDE